MDVDTYLAGWPYEDPIMGPPMSNFLPPIHDASEVADVLDASCVAVGVVDQFETSMRIFSHVLNRPLPETWSVKKNTAPRTFEVSNDLRDAFRDRNPLEYAIYDWAGARVKQMATAALGK
ncbi:hypothetical protein GCM10007385_44190 [Tateyamaria omphalii]|uniref:hypothetical protein n=1 Tax=Tateyamaria omphalii TaxID=299262 RepID=UPI001998B3EC|nr:hypothetical protein [Tateyamaria omphalii]GGX70347.1 hypothetical protein GCM10007385_44190 [Tateyamaria omphalii]